jgi:hypothetical protein
VLSSGFARPSRPSSIALPTWLSDTFLFGGLGSLFGRLNYLFGRLGNLPGGLAK